MHVPAQSTYDVCGLTSYDANGKQDRGQAGEEGHSNHSFGLFLGIAKFEVAHGDEVGPALVIRCRRVVLQTVGGKFTNSVL